MNYQPLAHSRIQPVWVKSELTLHPEFFEQPHPEPEPVPYEEPVIVWGAQQIENPAEKAVSPWEMSAISSTTQTANLQSQTQAGSTEGQTDLAGSAEVLEPYQLAYQIAVTAGVVLLLVVAVIFGVDLIP